MKSGNYTSEEILTQYKEWLEHVVHQRYGAPYNGLPYFTLCLEKLNELMQNKNEE